MRDKNSHGINEILPAAPKNIDIEPGFRSVHKVMRQLEAICNNARANHELYDRLDYALRNEKSKTYSLKGLQITLAKNIIIPVELFLLHERDGKRSSRGSVGIRVGKFFSDNQLRIRLGLYGDEDERLVQFVPSEYKQVLDHEVTHAYQKLEVALRASRMDKKSSSYIPSTKELSDKLKKVAHRKGSGFIINKAKKATNKEDEIKLNIEYFSRPSELGANANALLLQLIEHYGIESMDVLGNHLSFNKPTFEEVNDSILNDRHFKSGIWWALTALSQNEQAYLHVAREEWTKGWALKKELLKHVYEYYKRYYKNRRR